MRSYKRLGLVVTASVVTGGIWYKRHSDHQARLQLATEKAKEIKQFMHGVEDLIKHQQALKFESLEEYQEYWAHMFLNQHAQDIPNARAYAALMIEANRYINLFYATQTKRTYRDEEASKDALNFVVGKIMTAFNAKYLKSAYDIEELLDTLNLKYYDNSTNRLSIDLQVMVADMVSELPLVGEHFNDRLQVMSLLQNPGIQNEAKYRLMMNEKLHRAVVGHVTGYHDLMIVLEACSEYRMQRKAVMDELMRMPQVLASIRQSVSHIEAEEVGALLKQLRFRAGRGAPECLIQVQFLRLLNSRDMDDYILANSARLLEDRVLFIESLLYLQRKYNNRSYHDVDDLVRKTQEMSVDDVGLAPFVDLWNSINLTDLSHLLVTVNDYAALLIEAHRYTHGHFDANGYDEVEFECLRGGLAQMKETNRQLGAEGQAALSMVMDKLLNHFKVNAFKSPEDAINLLRILSKDTNCNMSTFSSTPSHFMKNLEGEVVKRLLDKQGVTLLTQEKHIIFDVLRDRKMHLTAQVLMKDEKIQEFVAKNISSIEELSVVITSCWIKARVAFLGALARQPDTLDRLRKSLSMNDSEAMQKILKLLYVDYDTKFSNGDAQIQLLAMLKDERLNSVLVDHLDALKANRVLHPQTAVYLYSRSDKSYGRMSGLFSSGDVKPGDSTSSVYRRQ